jgi:hypothetical protein
MENKAVRIALTIFHSQRLVAREYGRLSTSDYLSGRVHLQGIGALPPLRSIRSFDIDDTGGLLHEEADYSAQHITLDYRFMPNVIVKCPDIEY